VTSTISGLTISRGQDGGALGGGGVANSGTLTVNDCVFSDNISRFNHGGAIFNENKLTVNSCIFTGNRAATQAAGGLGGAIFNLVNAELYNCVFNNNQASDAGAISNYGNGDLAQLKVTGCSFSGNTATFGGAIDNTARLGPATASILESTFSGNTATTREGGAINNSCSSTNASLSVDRSVFSNNTAGGRGGGIANSGYSGASLVTVTNSAFQGNTGGALYNSVDTSSGGTATATLSISSCTLSGNVGSFSGGIFNNTNSHTGNGTLSTQVTSCTFSRNGDPSGNGNNLQTTTSGANGTANITVRNTILQKNTGPSSVNLVNSGGGVTSQGYNLCDDNGAGLLNGPGDLLNSDPQLDPLGMQNNGGPTPTIALTSGSAALDQGNNFGLPSDQRGLSRPFDNPSIPNATNGTDIGAYEAQGDVLQSGYPSFVVTTNDDHNDGVCGALDCTLREAIARSNAVPGPNAITFAPGVTGTITLQPAVGGQLSITEGVTITGPGARILKISAFTQTRVFLVSGGGTTTISGLTIADGWVANSNAGDSEGGGIHNSGTLVLVDCTVDFNRAVGGSGFMAGQNGGSGRGGGVFNAGSLMLTRCTFKNNGASGGFGAGNPPPPLTLTTGGTGGDARGAGVYNDAAASLVISNCTFSGNNASAAGGGSGSFGGNGGNGFGGAIFNLGMLDVSASTLGGNTGDGGPGGAGTNSFNNGAPGSGVGGIARGAGSAVLRNSIVAGNNTNVVFRDVSGAFTSGGFNVIGRVDGSSGFGADGDQAGTNTAPARRSP
jgi:CSLREA domain-containing protein